jgi:hypothetical protein
MVQWLAQLHSRLNDVAVHKVMGLTPGQIIGFFIFMLFDLTDSILYLDVWIYEYEHYCNFRTVHQQNDTLHMGTYALLPSDQFLRTLQHPHEHSPLMTRSSKSSMSCGEKFKIF